MRMTSPGGGGGAEGGIRNEQGVLEQTSGTSSTSCGQDIQIIHCHAGVCCGCHFDIGRRRGVLSCIHKLTPYRC
jgi:hypothetical protein